MAGRSLQILCVEDNLVNVKLIERLLRQRPDTALIHTRFGRLALETALECRPDLVLLDLHLPDMSGEAALDQLKGHPATKNIPVVVMSGDSTPGTISRLLASGAKHYLTKPYNIGDFLALIDAASEKSTT